MYKKFKGQNVKIDNSMWPKSFQRIQSLWWGSCHQCIALQWRNEGQLKEPVGKMFKRNVCCNIRNALQWAALQLKTIWLTRLIVLISTSIKFFVPLWTFNTSAQCGTAAQLNRTAQCALTLHSKHYCERVPAFDHCFDIWYMLSEKMWFVCVCMG